MINYVFKGFDPFIITERETEKLSSHITIKEIESEAINLASNNIIGKFHHMGKYSDSTQVLLENKKRGSNSVLVLIINVVTYSSSVT